MELYLNYAWMCAAVTSACLWVRLGRRTLVHQHLSLVGLFLFIVILFPVISVTDDLWSVQNPAEAKTFQLREQRATSLHSASPGIEALLSRANAEFNFEPQRVSALLYGPLLAVDHPAPGPIQNRPPPWA
jgi:hypothetical protein